VTIIQNSGVDLGQLRQQVMALISGATESLGEEGEAPPDCPRRPTPLPSLSGALGTV
jgi:hypothetical protein